MTKTMAKNEARVSLRFPIEVKQAFKKIAKEEGLSENSALVQALVWALKFREGLASIKQ